MTREHGRAALPRATRLPLVLLALVAGLLLTRGPGPHDDDHSVGHVPAVVAAMAPDAGHDDHDDAIGLGDCLALVVLSLSLAALTLALARATGSLVAPRPVRVRLHGPGRPPGPPCLHRLSIMRC